MPKKIAKLGLYWLGSAAVAPLLVAACAGTPLSLGETAGAGGKASVAGSSASGGTMSGGSSSGGIGGSSQETCDKSACGPQLGLLNQLCADGSMSGPTGRCLKRANDSCGWEVLQCPPDGTGAGGDAGAGGSSTGGAGGSGGSGGAPDCTQLLDEVTKTQAVAQTCNPASAKPTPECEGSLEGLCCPIGVESVEETASANVSYLNALKAYKASCVYECPKIACFEPVVGDCKASSASSGKCGP